jgi:hypothetical protein
MKLPVLPTILAAIGLMTALPFSGAAQTAAELQTYFQQSIQLTPDEIASIGGGKAVGKVLKSRTPAEIFVFGAVRINAPPEAYIRLANDFDRLRRLPEFLAIGKFSDPPKVMDLAGFNLDSEDISALKDCKPGDCDIQVPANAMTEMQRSVNWSAPDAEDQVNHRLHQQALDRIQAYRREGNRALGVYDDEERPTDVSKRFEYLLSYSTALPKYLPDLHRYLLSYPAARPANVEELFYWAKVKFGLKPTLRVVQMVTLRGSSVNEPAYTIAEKQLYSSHYFNTALDLTFCIRDNGGFYLIKAIGSEQAGLTGMIGSILRKVAVSRTASSLENSLNAFKVALEREAASQ